MTEAEAREAAKREYAAHYFDVNESEADYISPAYLAARATMFDMRTARKEEIAAWVFVGFMALVVAVLVGTMSVMAYFQFVKGCMA